MNCESLESVLLTLAVDLPVTKRKRVQSVAYLISLSLSVGSWVVVGQPGWGDGEEGEREGES